MTYYLGKAGALVALPDPEAGLSITPERVGGTHQLLSGARVRDTLGTTWPRTWQMQWTALDLTSYGTLAQFGVASIASGPFYLLDPEQRNLLPTNVSTGTDTTGDTTGFTIAAASSIASSTSNTTAWNGSGGPFPGIGVRTLQIGLPGSLSANSALVNGPNVPVVVGVTYTLSAYILNGVASYVEITWRDSAGSTLSATGGSVVAQSVAGRSVATGTAPANAAYASLVVRNNTSTVGTTTMYADGLQFEAASAVSAWVPGLGVPLVTVEASPRSVPLAGITDVQWTLVQVG